MGRSAKRTRRRIDKSGCYAVTRRTQRILCIIAIKYQVNGRCPYFTIPILLFYCLTLSISNKIKVMAIRRQVLASAKKVRGTIPPIKAIGV